MTAVAMATAAGGDGRSPARRPFVPWRGVDIASTGARTARASTFLGPAGRATAVLAIHAVVLGVLTIAGPSPAPVAAVVAGSVRIEAVLIPPAATPPARTLEARPGPPTRERPPAAPPPRPMPSATATTTSGPTPTDAAIAAVTATAEVQPAAAASAAPPPPVPDGARAGLASPHETPAGPVLAERTPRRTGADHAACGSAVHPAALRERGIEGRVVLQVLVGADGRAREVQVRTGSGWRLFDEAAVAQARGCRFRPATEDGVAVDSWVEYPVRFALGR